VRRLAALAVSLPLSFAFPALAREAPGVVIAPEDRPPLGTKIRQAMAAYDSASAFPLPALDDERMRELFDGEVVRFREKWRLPGEGENAKERHRVLAFRLIRAPRVAVWLSTLDSHFPLNDSITAVVLDEASGGKSTWYQYMDLPWPVRNRHWVIHFGMGVDVCAKTQGVAWELFWHLVPSGEQTARDLAASGRAGGLSLDKVKDARYLEANDGAWAVFALDDDLTLIAYNLTIVMGGLVPEGMAARFAQGALEQLMDRIAANVAKVPAHYVGDHEPIYAGDGTEIPRGVIPVAAK
jgi:hypothetical protein